MRFLRLTAGIEQLDAFSDQHDDLATALFTDAHELLPDGDGRLVLPEELIAHAGLVDAVACMGLGSQFQIWEPEAAKRRVAEARLRARERGMTLPVPPAPPSPPVAGNSQGGATSPLNTTPGAMR